MTKHDQDDPRRNPQPIADGESGSFNAPQTPAAGGLSEEGQAPNSKPTGKDPDDSGKSPDDPPTER
ncbi:hypothetical protein BH23CHL4_BH23CHL4_23590 [soil metagenome]